METILSFFNHSKTVHSAVVPVIPDALDVQCPGKYMDVFYDYECAAELLSIIKEEISGIKFTAWESVIITVLYGIIVILALFGNGLVILAVIRKRAMRTSRNVLIVNLAISNFFLAVIVVPLLWIPALKLGFDYGRVFCKLANAFPGGNIYCSTLTVCAMAIDRYYTVTSVRLMEADSRKRAVSGILAAVGIWMTAMALSLPILVYFDINKLIIAENIPVMKLDEGRTANISLALVLCQPSSSPEMLVVSVMQMVFLYVVPIAVLLLFNYRLNRFLKANERQMTALRSPQREDSQSQREVIYVEQQSTLVAKNGLQQQAMVTLSRNSSSQRTNQRRNRTTMLLVAMAASYGLLWLPYTLITILVDVPVTSHWLEQYSEIVSRVDQLFKLVSTCSVCVNPFLYGWLNTNFNREFREIFNGWSSCGRRQVNNNRAPVSAASHLPKASRVNNNQAGIENGALLHSPAAAVELEMEFCDHDEERDTVL